MGFSIDDVRESFTTDVSDTLAFVEESAKALLANGIFVAAGLPEEGGRTVFERIGERAHAVAGTSALVQAASLHQTARLLESIAQEGRDALAALERSRRRVRALGELCLEGTEVMRAMLDLELEYRGEEAVGHSQAWHQRVTEVREGLTLEPSPGPTSSQQVIAAPLERPGGTEEQFPDVPSSGARPAAPAMEFDFEGVAEPPPAPSGDPRLVDVFLDEAREATVELSQRLRALTHTPGDPAAQAAVQRIFFTLKSSSAMASLNDVADLADEGLHVIETMLAGGPATLEQVTHLTRSAQRLLAAAGLAPAQLGAAAAARGPATGNVAEFFREEARQVVSEARSILARLPSAERPRDRLAQLGQLFHRLKGSALIVGQHDVATESARLQAACEGGTVADALAMAPEGLTGIARQLGLDEAEIVAAASVMASATREEVAVTAGGELWEAFLTEFHELLVSTERRILELDHTADPKGVLEALFRDYHTLKGAVNTVGLKPTGRVLHRVEDFVSELGEAPILPAMRGLTAFLLDVQQLLRDNLASAPQGWVEISMARIEARIAALKAGEGRAAQRGDLAAPEPSDSVSSRSGMDSGSSGSASSASASGSLAPPSSSSMAGGEARERRMLRVPTERLDALMNLGGELVLGRLRIANRLSLVRGVAADLATSWRRLSLVIDDFRGQHEFTMMVARRGAPESQIGPATWGGSAFAELELDRYDDVNLLARQVTELSDDVDELEGQLQREVASLSEDADSLSGIVSEMQRELTVARMVPLKPLFARLRLPIRDAAESVGRDVRVSTRGEDVTVDKEVVDALFTPLIHLVRNAVSHGIETREVRLAAGKPPEGLVQLVARQESARIVIEVRDDGAGLDLGELKRRGVEMGLVAPSTPLEHRSVKDLVFVRGLSTHAMPGDVAGRGVGCDAVREAVEQMGGGVRVESVVGQGTIFIITLPLTLAITRAVLVKAGGRVYAVPMVFVERIVEGEAVLVESAGLRRVDVAGQLTTARALGEILGVPSAGRGPVVLVRVGDQASALMVDEVLGQEEIVVKNLGEILTGHPLFAGLTVRGSGDLVLILDVPGLLANTELRPRATGPAALASRRPAELAGAARLRALYVDDSLSVRKFAERALGELGVDVTTAVDGLDALARLRGGGYDIVFTDLEMPRMNGYDLLRELRYIPMHRELPVVVVSSRTLEKHREQARSLGASEFVTKPFSGETLAGVIRKWTRVSALPGKKE